MFVHMGLIEERLGSEKGVSWVIRALLARDFETPSCVLKLQ